MERGEAEFKRKKVEDDDTDGRQAKLEAVDMSDIESLLAAAADVGEGQRDSRLPESDFDLDAFLQGEDELTDLGEIGTLLRKDENKEWIGQENTGDNGAEFWEAQGPDMEGEDSASHERIEDELDRKAAKKAAREARKAKRAQDRAAKKGAKEDLEDIVDRVAGGGGFWNRIMTFLMEEDEEDEVPMVAEEESLNLSDENLLILEALRNESPEDGDPKRKTEEEKQESSDKGKKKRKEGREKKAPRGKKKKKQNAQDQAAASVRLPAGKVRLIGALGFSLAVFLISFTMLGADLIERKKAMAEFYRGNYQESYQGLLGKKRSRGEEAVYHRSEIILKMRLQLMRYEWIAEHDTSALALDSLIQSVVLHPSLREAAIRWNVEEETDLLYGKLLAYLETYGLTEEDAVHIGGISDDLAYSKAIYGIVENRKEGPIEAPEAAPPEDLLVEEELLPNTVFYSE